VPGIQRSRGRELDAGTLPYPDAPFGRRGQSWVSRFGHTFALHLEAAVAEMRVN